EVLIDVRHRARGTAHAASVLGAAEAPRRQGGNPRGEPVAARVAARVRDPSPAPRRRSARRPAAPGTRRYRDDDDLHARRARALETTARRTPSARVRMA